LEEARREGGGGGLTIEFLQERDHLGVVGLRGALEDALRVDLALEDPVDEDAGELHVVGLDLARLDELLHLGDADLGRPAGTVRASEQER
jgi:hypothetical protein